MTRPLAVDLFAGTGGATAAFSTAGWDVVAVDLQSPPRCPGGRGEWIRADVRALPLRIRRPVDFLWASPPCTEFSTANPNRPARPSLELVVAVLEAVRDFRPRFWILENVAGAIPLLGIPVQKIGPWCLWGYFPLLEVTWAAQTYRKGRHATAAARAAIPWELSRAALEAVELYRHNFQGVLDLRPFRRHRHRAAKAAAGPEAFWRDLWGAL